jgi:branched-chain amino acid transport system substrate-binding protein
VRKILVSIVLISVLLVGLVGTASASDGVIKIGAAVSLTGKMAYEGRLVKDGYEVWADWVNSHGGINAGGKNYEVKMVYYDDESTPVRGAKLTEKLITQNKVDFYLVHSPVLSPLLLQLLVKNMEFLL